VLIPSRRLIQASSAISQRRSASASHPSPAVDPHGGMVRSRCFNYAFGAHYGGTFVFRIEDTDTARKPRSRTRAPEHHARIVFDGDEAPRPRPRSSYVIRADGHLRGHAAKLRPAPSSPLATARGELDGVQKRVWRGEAKALYLAPGYAGTCRFLSAEQIASTRGRRTSRAAGSRAGPGPSLDDIFRGEISFDSANVNDYVAVARRQLAFYTLVNPIDDALMRITPCSAGG